MSLFVLVCERYLFESSWIMWSGRLFLVGYLLLFSGPCSVVQDLLRLTSRTFVYRIWAFILCLISVICIKVTAVHIPDISVIRASTRSHIRHIVSGVLIFFSAVTTRNRSAQISNRYHQVAAMFKCFTL